MDYSPTRGLVWGLFDRLARHYADEIWVLRDRGLPKQKVVPIGCWYYEIKRSRQKGGIVYIGLVEEMQGVGLLMKQARNNSLLCYTIIGVGKDLERYKAMKLKNVKFLGLLSDKDAQKELSKHSVGWDNYHPNNPTIKTTLPTKPMTYMSCGVIPASKSGIWSRRKCLAYARKHDWARIFKQALNEKKN